MDPAAEYLEIGVRSHGLGVFHKDAVSGAVLGSKSVYEVVPGCLVFNIVFAWEGAVAITRECDRGRIASHRFPMLRARAERVDLEYLRLVLLTSRGRHWLRLASPGGAGRNRTLNMSELLDIQLSLPDVSAQRAVATVSLRLSSLESTCQRAIDSKRRLKQALLQQLLTGKLRARSHRTAWRSAKLGELGEFVRGVSYDAETDMRSAADGDAVALLRAGNLQAGELRLDDVYFIDPRRCSPRQLLAPGDVAICMSNGSRTLVGKASQIRSQLDRPTTVGAFCTIFRPSPGVDHEFIRQVFAGSKYRAWIARALAGSAINNLRASVIESLEVDIPTSPDEERFVGNTLGLLDTELNLLDRQLAAVRKLKRGLMQKLLTGELEVPAAEEPKGDEVHA
ncbi:MAG: hypothetical protein IT454_18020 [Planctomycetes bacterium]|nr:hypothetical protein [Planctomycetota bacterium]